MGGDEREAAEYAPEENPDYEAFVLVRAFLDELPAHGDAIAGYSRNGLQHALTEPMLRALVAGYEKLRTERSAVLARGAELEAENARMREELAALIEAQPSLQGSAFRIGWQTCRDKVNRATELLRGELAALDYANEVRKLNAEAPHRPEMFADECDCDCQPGQPTGADAPVMIYPREVLFRVCFPYGAQAEIDAGKGRVVRLAVTEVGDA